MSDYTKINLSEVKDLAPEYGMGDMGEARFARRQLGAEQIGLTMYAMNGGRRIGFGHTHREVEEAYLVLSGSGRFKVGDEVIDVGPRDVVFVPPGTMREWEAGPDGMELRRLRRPRGGRRRDEARLVDRLTVTCAGRCGRVRPVWSTFPTFRGQFGRPQTPRPACVRGVVDVLTVVAVRTSTTGAAGPLAPMVWSAF